MLRKEGKIVVENVKKLMRKAMGIVLSVVLTLGCILGSGTIAWAEGETADAAAKIKVACVGDSLTEGYTSTGANSGKKGPNAYPARLQSLLGSGYEVKNFGETGAFLMEGTSNPYKSGTEYEQSKAYNADIVIIMLGTNDCKSFYNASAKDIGKGIIKLIEQIRHFDDNIEKYNRPDFKVVIDTANGATYQVADKVFKTLGINHVIINNHPDGININDKCGSTHLEMLKEYVVKNKMSLGIAYDGDGDRCLAVDENGEELDGDKILAIIANYLKPQGKLAKDTIVATVMSNLGLNKYAESNKLNFVQTKVGDRYVLEEMLKNGYNLGGEQSGHVILLDYNPTGDGILTSLMLIQALLESGKKSSELGDLVQKYPQVLINAKVDSNKKYDYEKNSEIKSAIEKVEKEFSGNGRVLIRPSGTEPLVRVMIEGKDIKVIEQRAKEIADLIEEKCK